MPLTPDGHEEDLTWRFDLPVPNTLVALGWGLIGAALAALVVVAWRRGVRR